MSVLDHRRRSATAHAVPTSPSPASSPFFQRTRGVSPTQRASSRRHSSRTAADSTPPLRHSSSRKISRNNPPHVNNDIAKSQFASMNPRPHTPVHPEFDASSTTLVNPTSSILQGLIKEQRATRNSRKTPQLPEDVDRRPTTSGSQSQSHENSPSEKQRRANSAVLSGLKQPRDMGIREMDQYVSKMNKLNFDLKLEIFHRTQQIATLEKKMERMHEMEEELARMRGLEDELDELREVEENNQRLREANEHLQTELDRRDQAISEAVELICHLEAKVEELQANCESVRTFGDGATVVLDNSSEICTPKAQSFVDIPDRTSSKKGTVRRPRKSPSFLREEDRSTAALRSLFLADENKSCRSVSQSTIGTTVDSTGDPPSPRLSILSECSYFNPQDIQQPASNEFDHLESLDRLKLAESDPLAVTPVRTSAVSPSHHLSDQISDWMHYNEITPRSSRVGKNRKARAFSDVSRSSHAPIAQLDEPFQVTRKTRQRQYPSPRQQHLSDFGGQLPPTPDTMSTSRPVLGNVSNVNLAKDPGHFGSREMLTTLSRPRSADELTTRSTSLSTRSDGIDTTASVDTRYNVRDVPKGLLSSFSHYGRGSAKATCVLGPGSPSNPRLSCYGGDLLFNGEGVENVTFDASASRVSSLNSSTPAHQVSKELPTSSTLTPQEWLEAARTENDVDALKEKNSTLEVKEETSVVLGQGNANQNNVEDTKVGADETVGDNTPSPRNPPLRLRAWADEAQSASETPQPRRRLSLRPRFFSRNRHQTPETQADAVATVPKGPYSTPDKSLALLVSKHRRTSSGPGLNVGEGTTPLGQTAVRPLPKPRSDLRPSTASRPMTSDSAEPRSKGSLFLGWMKGSHGKETESSPTAHLGVARSITERPKSTASIDVSSLILGQEGDRAPVDDEPVWRARRRSRRMV